MNTALIVSTLKALPIFGGRVVVASDLPAALEAVKPFAAMPCCIVHGLAERADGNALATGGPRQRVTVSLRLLIVHRDVTEPYGAAAMTGIHAAVIGLHSALLGLIPDDGYDPLLYAGGQLAYAQAGTIMWLDEWRTAFYLSPDGAVYAYLGVTGSQLLADLYARLDVQVRVDAAQSFTSPQQARGRSNIAAAAALDLSSLVTAIGNPERDFTTDYATAKA